jgi:Undecaprenyl-phosphate glucose phosphotransferase
MIFTVYLIDFDVSLMFNWSNPCLRGAVSSMPAGSEHSDALSSQAVLHEFPKTKFVKSLLSEGVPQVGRHSDMRREPEKFIRRLVSENRRSFLTIVQMVGDAIIFGVSSASVLIFQALTYEPYHRDQHPPLYIWATALTATAFIIGCARSGVYDPLPISAAAAPLRVTVRRLLEVLLLLTGCLFVLKIGDRFSRVWLFSWSVASFVALCGARIATRAAARGLVRSGKITRNLAIIGADEIARQLAAELAGLGRGTRLVGLFDDVPSNVPAVRAIAELEDLASKGRVDEIIVAAAAGERIVELCRRFHPFSVAIRTLAPKGFEYFRVLESCRFGKINTFLVVRKPLNEEAVILKWLEDKTIALLCLVLVLPLMLLIAMAIKLDSRGPMFFRQQRLGANNRPFKLLKFRSMYVDQADPLGTRLTRAGDPRVTRVGRLLRKTSLDELPQLINVLRGDMSLVGPRPHAIAARAGGVPYVEAVHDYPLRHRVKPGITGWAQVNGWRGETERIEQLQGRVQCDLYYVENWSLGLDLLILGRTAVTVLSRHNAV